MDPFYIKKPTLTLSPESFKFWITISLKLSRINFQAKGGAHKRTKYTILQTNRIPANMP